jgi:hypothetical protein
MSQDVTKEGVMFDLVRKHFKNIVGSVTIMLCGVTCVITLMYYTFYLDQNYKFGALNFFLELIIVGAMMFLLVVLLYDFVTEVKEVKERTKELKIRIRKLNFLLLLREVKEDVNRNKQLFSSEKTLLKRTSDNLDKLIQRLGKFRYYERDYYLMTGEIVGIIHNLDELNVKPDDLRKLKNNFREISKFFPYDDLRKRIAKITK